MPALEAQTGDLDVELAPFDTRQAGAGVGPGAPLAVARSLPVGGDALGLVWLERAGPDLVIYTARAGGRDALLRTVADADPTDLSVQEEVGVIVRGMVEGLVAGHPIGFVPPAAPQAPVPSDPSDSAAPRPVAPVPSQASRFGLALQAAYLTGPYTEATGWQQGGRIGLRVATPGGAYGQLSASLMRGLDYDDGRFAIFLTRTPLDAAAGWRYRWEGWSVAPELGLQLDLVQRRAQAVASNVSARPDRLKVAVALTGRLWLSRALGRPDARTWLAVGAGVEAVLHNINYTVTVVTSGTDSGTEDTLLEPNRIRPVLMAALVIDL